MHSPPPRQPPRVSVRRDDACDNISIASSDPRTHRDQRQVLQERAHEITVVTRLPLQRILHNLDATRRIVEWALELSSFGLKFESTSAIQSRILAEFIAEWTSTPDEEIQEIALPGKEADRDWIMYFDGAFSLQGAGAGVLLVAPTGEHLKYGIQMHFF